VHCTTKCNTQSSVLEDGQNNCQKHVELSGIINKPLILHLFGCLYYLYQWCTVKQISDNEIYLLMIYIKSVLWRIAKRLSHIEDARCPKIKQICEMCVFWILPMKWIYVFRVIPAVWLIKAHRLLNPIFCEKYTSIEGVRDRRTEENIFS
jgi:hypothetical protein